MKKQISFSIVLILAGTSILITNKIIGNFKWYLRSDFIWTASFIIPFGVFLLGVFSLKTIKKKGFKIFLIVVWTLIIIVVTFVEFIILCWTIKTTVIKEIDGDKYCGVEYLSNRLRKEVYYYKDYNIFAYHETKEYIKDFYDYNDYEHPLYREYYKEKSQDRVIYDYDKEGNITKITTYNEDDKIIETQP